MRFTCGSRKYRYSVLGIFCFVFLFFFPFGSLLLHQHTCYNTCKSLSIRFSEKKTEKAVASSINAFAKPLDGWIKKINAKRRKGATIFFTKMFFFHHFPLDYGCVSVNSLGIT